MTLNVSLGERDVIQRYSIQYEFLDIRIVILNFDSFIYQFLNDRNRGRFAHIINVLLVCDSKHK
ncbi:hypothetical protein D3C73_1343980 [compost metagenome]